MTMAETKEYSTGPRRLSLDEMKQFLWGAAVRLRGQIDAAGYKEYIFPLLFFKRISDVYDEQYDGYVAEGGAEYANSQVEDFAIRIPDEAHWRDVRAVTENVGQRLVEAFIAIEQANPGVRTDGRIVGGLEGIFGPKDIWTNKNKMPDHIITSLIEDFSRYNLSIAACPADEMGQAYEYLVGKFADDAGNTAQEFYTNRTVVTLMAEILKPQPGESVYDPTCGSGGMLVKCLDYLREKGQPWQSVKVFGQEINALTSSIARMNLYLNGVEDFSIVREDTLKNPAFVDGSHLRTFDVVLANPPYSIKAWDRDAFANDKWGRNFLGTPPQGRADYAFLQHIIASMNPKSGRCAILFPHGVLFRKEEKDMRESLIKSDKIEAVIGLGPNLFYNSPMEACIIICNNNKPENRRGKILMINAVNEVVRKNAESYLEESHINRILQAFNGDAEIEGFSSLVSNEVIIEKNSDLTISLYAYSSSLNVVTLGDENPQGDWSEIRRSLWNTLSLLVNSLGCILDINDFYPVSSHMVLSLKMFTLEDVADEVKQTWRKDTENVPVVGLEHIIPGEIVLTQYDINPNEHTFTKKFEKGQILLGRRRVYQKKACVAPFDGICSGDITTIQAKVVDNFEPGLLPFIIQNDRFFDYAVQGSAGSLSPRVKWEYLKRYSFLLPESIEDQRALAEKLRAAYRLKEAYKRLLSAIDEMVKSQFLELFGNPVTNPMGWPTERIDIVAPESPSKEDLPDSTWVLNLDMIESNTGQIISKQRLNADKTLSVLPFDEGNVLFSKLRPYLNKVVLPDEKGLATTELVPLRPNPAKLSKVFFTYLLRSDQFVQFANDIAGGTKMPRMPLSELRKFQCILPPIESQLQFEFIVDQADKSKFELKRAIEAVDKVIKSLING